MVAKFPDTITAEDILETRCPLDPKKLMLKSNIYKVKRRCFSIAQRCFRTRRINQLVELLDLVFSEKSDTTCEENQLTCIMSRDFLPRLHDGQLSHFFIKFDNIIDLLISIEESINDAFNTLDTSERDELGIELWDTRGSKSQLVYDNMLRLFVNGYVPDYLRNPDGIEVIPAMIRFKNLSNKKHGPVLIKGQRR